jgi:S-adenosylmethionine/arginine decarboxylase-like enzyme
MTAPVHKHFILRAEVSKPPLEKDQYYIHGWMKKLIEDIDMNIMFGPEVRYVTAKGNEGLTAFAIIETSHVALHCWDKLDIPLLQLDVYTCGPLSPEKILDAVREFLPTKLQWKYLDREKDLETVDMGEWNKYMYHTILSSWPPKINK